MSLFDRFLELLCRNPEILKERILEPEPGTLVYFSKEFDELLARDPRHAYELQELEVQEWPEFTIPSMRAELIKCIGYSNRSCLYSVLLKDGEVHYVSYDSAIIK